MKNITNTDGMKNSKKRPLSFEDRIKLEIKRLEYELSVCENKLIVSEEATDPFSIFKQKLVDQINIAKSKLESRQNRFRNNTQQNPENFENLDQNELSIVEKISEINRRIESVKLNMKAGGSQKSRMKTLLHALQNQVKALKEKQNNLSVLSANLTLDSTRSSNPNGLLRRTSTVSNNRFFEYIRSQDSALNLQITVGWEAISFEDRRVKIRFEPRKFLYFAFSQSRSSYEFVKFYLLKKKLAPLELFVLNGKIREVKNLELLNDAIQLLKIQLEWSESFKQGKTANVPSILDSLGNLSSKVFRQFYQNKELTPYLNELCNLQGLEYHLIPVLQPFSPVNSKFCENHSFLFTVIQFNVLYIVWESIESNKATYIFKTNKVRYLIDLQNIFDFISSRIKNKRTNLKSGIFHSDGKLIKSHHILYHTDFAKWKEKLLEIIRQ